MLRKVERVKYDDENIEICNSEIRGALYSLQKAQEVLIVSQVQKNTE